MTHNIIEEYMDEVLHNCFPEKIDYNRGKFRTIVQHYLIKHIDSEIERLEEIKAELSRKYPNENKLWQTITDGSLIVLTDQITHLQSLKAELTKKE